MTAERTRIWRPHAKTARSVQGFAHFGRGVSPTDTRHRSLGARGTASTWAVVRCPVGRNAAVTNKENRAPRRPPVFDLDPEVRRAARVNVERFDRTHARARAGSHSYRSLELIYFEEGGGQHRIGDCSWEVSVGNLFLISLGEVHDVGEIGGARGWAVEFSADAMRQRVWVDFLWPGNPPSALASSGCHEWSCGYDCGPSE